MRNFILLVSLAAASACSLDRLTGTKPEAKPCAATIHIGGDRLTTRDTAIVPMLDSAGHVVTYLQVSATVTSAACPSA